MNTTSGILAAWISSFLIALGPARAAAAEWCPPVSIPSVNSPGNDNGPEVSSDERTLHFASSRSGSEGAGDLYVSRRATRDGEWKVPMNLDAIPDGTSGVNTSSTEQGPALWHGGHVLFFSSDRPGGLAPPGSSGQGCGPTGAPVLGSSCDIWVAERRDAKDDQGWAEPWNVGAPVNSEYAEGMGDLFENDATGMTELYFSSSRPSGPGDAPGDHDIYVVRLDASGTFGEPELIPEVSSPAVDQRVTVASDGLVMLFQSTRTGGHGSSDLWMSSRPSLEDRWSEPVNLGPPVNTALFEGGPRLSANGKTLYFFSGSPAGVDLFMSRRARVDGTCEE